MKDDFKKNISNKADNESFLISAITNSACSKHRPKELDYLKWSVWAEQKTKKGAKQKQCSKCGRWYFREEF